MKIEIQPLTNDAQADVEMMQQDIDAEGYEVTVSISGDKIILTSETSDLQNMIADENFRECYLNNATVEVAKNLIHDDSYEITGNRDRVAEAKAAVKAALS